MSNLAEAWTSLGVAYHSKSSEIPSSPEEGLYIFLKSGEFPEDKKMIAIIIEWLRQYSKIVHVERLKNYCPKLTDLELAILGGLAKKCISFGDHRWKIILKIVHKKLGKSYSFIGDSESYILLKGLDTDFSSFGLQIANIKSESLKKFIPRDILIKKNTWIKNRILFGSNLRSDIASIRELGLANTAYQAAKIALCSMNAAYRNWADLEDSGWFVAEKR